NPARRVDHDPSKRRQIFALAFRQTHYHRVLSVAFPDLRRLFTTHCRLDHTLDVRDVQSISRRALPVDFDLNLRNLTRAIDERAIHSVDCSHSIENALSTIPQCPHVIAEHADDDLSLDLRNTLQDVVPNRLRETRLIARHCFQGLLKLRQKI